ncbi:hypothetical protein HHL28_00555 [Aerophototrophica crusticola]|uniref:Secreted protein n=1 Tax=Aerophototrophica crusticola TaxID=1709002 RepID=A0A858R344_9PROT|nr:hypothetical protein HHL28_00555 [Rhodospirillaceae bacterium B3]
MMNRKTFAGAALAAALLLGGPAALAADTAVCPTAVRAEQCAKFQQDRQAILAMAGDYKVRFDFRETVSFLPDYAPIPPKQSGGHEVVRVIADTGTAIMLQHLLVVEGKDGKPVVIKHWRQDWAWEPASVLAYQDSGRWAVVPVGAANREGAWSQTVWQTDDSPRYGGVGRWTHDLGVPRWTSGEGLRPLARRDAVRKPPYDRYLAVNRHALTPTGWVHEQDNAKLGPKDGKPATFVHEVVLNTYTKFDGYPVAAADGYWEKTATYWAAVRRAWDEVAARDGGIHVREEAENGSVTGPTLMELADKVAEGTATTPDAIAQARRTISDATRVPGKKA